MAEYPTTILETRLALQQGALSAVDLVKHSLAVIEEQNPTLNAFLEVTRETALTAAAKADKAKTPANPKARLGGIPIAVKDMICTREGHTTAASHILQHFTSPYEASVITALKGAGAIVIGKTNLDEFAMGSSTEYSAFGVVKNPWDLKRVSGGSSGGSAVAVASGQALGALGTDTGGSIRQPASFCNVVGLKPTYGRVSRFGVIAYGSSLDQVGPLARTVPDAALLLQAMAGPDPADATTHPGKVPDFSATLNQGVKGVKVAVPREFFMEGVQSEVATLVHQAIGQLEKLGARITAVSLPLTPAAVAVYFLIAKAEASTNLARYDGLRFTAFDRHTTALLEHYLETRGQGFGPEVKRAILMGTYALSAGYYEAWYKQASKVRTLIRREYEKVFSEHDVVVGPVSPEVAFPIGSKANDPLAMYLSDALTVPMSVAGLPAISVPCGFAQCLPVGLQITASHFQEEKLFQVAYAYEQSQSWWKQRPAITDKLLTKN